MDVLAASLQYPDPTDANTVPSKPTLPGLRIMTGRFA